MMDMQPVLRILDEVNKTIAPLNGRSHSDDGTRSAERAAISRDLNYAADSLELAASLIRREYWAARAERSAS